MNIGTRRRLLQFHISFSALLSKVNRKLDGFVGYLALLYEHKSCLQEEALFAAHPTTHRSIHNTINSSGICQLLGVRVLGMGGSTARRFKETLYKDTTIL